METTHTTTRHIGGFPILEDQDGCETLLFPDAQILWKFQSAQEFRDGSHYDWYHEDLVHGERAFNRVRDEMGYDADEIMDWLQSGDDFAYRTSTDAVIWGAS